MPIPRKSTSARSQKRKRNSRRSRRKQKAACPTAGEIQVSLPEGASKTIPECGSTQTMRSATAWTPGTFSAATRSALRFLSSRITPSNVTTPFATSTLSPCGTQGARASSAKTCWRMVSSLGVVLGSATSDRRIACSRSARLKLEMTLPRVFPGVIKGDGSADERWEAVAAGSAARSGSETVDTEAAAQLLELERRQVYRLLKAYRAEGATGLISKRRGRRSNRRKPEAGAPWQVS
jgi:hypothetical protein